MAVRRIYITSPAMLGLLLLATCFLPPESSAADKVPETRSLDFVPADADFYMSSSHHADQFSALMGSKAAALAAEIIAEIQAMENSSEPFPLDGIESVPSEVFPEPPIEERPAPEVPEGVEAIPSEFLGFDDEERATESSDPPFDPESAFEETEFEFAEEKPAWDLFLDPLRQWSADPENRELMPLAIDAVSHEFFMYTTGYAEITELQQEIYQRFANEMMRYVRENPTVALDDATMQNLDWEKIIPWEKIEAASMPDIVMGLKVSDPTKVARQLVRLHGLIEEGLKGDGMEMFAERFTAERIGKHPFLSIQLDGEMIPWEEAEFGALPADKQILAERAMKIVKKKTLTAALGVWNDYLIVSIGDNHDHLANLGEGELLIDRPEFAKLREHDDKTVVSVSYLSKRFSATASNLDGTFDYYRAMASMLLNEPESDLDAMVRSRIERDLKELQTDIVGLIPKRERWCDSYSGMIEVMKAMFKTGHRTNSLTLLKN